MEFTDYDTRLAAYAVIVDATSGEDRILLALWNEADVPRWTLPGGGVELEESTEQGAVREVCEETGYDVRLGRLLGVHTYVVPPERRLSGVPRHLKPVRVIYEADIIGGELRNELDGSTDEARWFPITDVSSLPRVGLVDIGLDLYRAAQ